jgi:membrane carboxypeptidase/penicillin-binding protein
LRWEKNFAFAQSGKTWEEPRISKHLYSWEKPVKRGPRTRFFLRWWFYGPVLLCLVAVLAAWVAYVYMSAQFEKRASEFDLSQMSHMEAASIILDRKGKEMGKIFIQNRNPVPLSSVNPMMVKAVIAAEDNKFYKHKGVDYMGVIRAALANYRRGRIAQGASTVTQQVARNSFDLRERTYKRKILEMFLAERIEKNFSKDEIMELYLNRVYFGSGFYGVEAAARGYFGRSAKDLEIGQCAMLAGLLKNPNGLSPWNNKEGATRTRNVVLRKMREEGFINRQTYDLEVEAPLLVMKRTNPFKVSYAIDYIRQQAIAALGYERAMNGGFRILTTLDQDMQRTAEAAMRETLAKIEQRPGYDHVTFEAFRKIAKPIEDEINRGNMTIKMPEPKYLQGAVMALENSTGGVLAMVGGRDFKHSEYNRATMARRPAGTAFTPFVFAAAYDKGIFPGDIVEDACMDNRYVMIGGNSGILGEWGVERADNEYDGPIPTRAALALGKNAATVRLGLRTGLDSVIKVAKDSGISSPLRNYTNTFLGSSEATLAELTLAYTVFPNGGFRPKQPYIIEKITDTDGKTIFAEKSEKVRAVSPEAAWQVHAGLEEAIRLGTGSAAFANYGLKNMPVGGKTGTAYNFTDTYFFGYNSSVTCGVWVGFDRPTRIYRGAFGKDLALPIWTRVMNQAADRFPAVAIPRPDTLKPVEICRVSGLLATPKCVIETAGSHGVGYEPCTYTEYATASQTPEVRCDVHGGGIRNWAKVYDQEEWPRPTAVVDLATIRPVAVMSPALLGLDDVYNSVRATARFEDIQVQKAIPVNQDQPQDAPEGAPAEAPAAVPVAAPVSEQTAAASGVEPEVRKAEAVTPLDSPVDAPAIQAPTPEPINF